MSTKIHSGYILAPGTDPFEFSRRLRQAMDPIRDRLDAALAARLIAERLDRSILAGEPLAGDAPVKAYLEWRKEQEGLKESERGHDPHRFEASIGDDPATGRLHLLVFADKSEYEEALEDVEGVEEYGYWNNTDRPEGVSEEEWDARRDAWGRVMPSGVPIEHMLSFTLRGKYSPGMLSLVSDRSPLVPELAPGPVERARNLIINHALKGLTQGLRGEEVAGSFYGWLRRLSRHKDTVGEELAQHLPVLDWETAFAEALAPGPEVGQALDWEATRLIEAAGLSTHG